MLVRRRKGQRNCSSAANCIDTIARTPCWSLWICRRLRELSKPLRSDRAWWLALRSTWRWWRASRGQYGDSFHDAAWPRTRRCPYGSQLLDAVERFVALLESPQDIRPLAPLVMREITYRLLTGPQGSRLRQIASAGAPAHRISKAILWLKNHFTEPLSIESLAERVGLSSSSLHQHFKGITAMSPLQYQNAFASKKPADFCLANRSTPQRLPTASDTKARHSSVANIVACFGAPPRKDVAVIKLDV